MFSSLICIYKKLNLTWHCSSKSKRNYNNIVKKLQIKSLKFGYVNFFSLKLLKIFEEAFALTCQK